MTHDRDCDICREQAPAITTLAPALRLLPVPSHDAGRDRARLLEAAARLPTRRIPRAAIAGIALAVAIVAVVVATRGASPTRITVQPTSARWSRHDGADATLVRLEDGALELQVAHGTQARRLVVSVPDGEIDDLGTTFRIDVANGRTRAVIVREGAVVVRLVGSAPVFLVAGEHWAPPVVPAPPIVPAPIAPPPVMPPPPVNPASPRTAPSPASELAAAVRLFDAGNLAAATAALRAFIAHHPDDTRAEDAHYLLVVVLDRSGDGVAADAAARVYLEHYPHGFRRADVEARRH